MKFVWIKGLRSPVAEKWADDMPAGAKEGKEVICERQLRPGEETMAIAILEQRYPLPKQ